MELYGFTELSNGWISFTSGIFIINSQQKSTHFFAFFLYLAEIDQAKFPEILMKRATHVEEDFSTFRFKILKKSAKFKCFHVKVREKSWFLIPHKYIWNQAGAFLEGFELTLNRFQKQFLFQTICFSYIWDHYNWHQAMGNCFLVNFLMILHKFNYCFMEIAANFCTILETYFWLLTFVAIRFLAHKVKKEYLRITNFFFAITLEVLPKVDSWLTGRKYRTRSWEMKSKIAK